MKSAGPSSTPLRVLVDAVAAGAGRGGGTHIVEQLKALSGIGGLRITVYATGEVAKRLAIACPGVDVRTEPHRSLPARLLWEQLVLAARTDGYDVVYATGNFALFGARCPQVIALQTINHFGHAARAFRKRMPRRLAARLAVESFVARRSLTRAEGAVVVSRTLRAAIEEDLGASGRLHVVRSAAPELPRADGSRREGGLAALPEGGFVLSVGHDYHHKDWDGLISAFLRHPDLPPLVLVGACRDARRRVQLEELSLRSGEPPRVRFLGHVDDPVVLAALYQRSACYVAHSHLESFSLTPCEAMSLGSPVAVSDIPAHREVCGDAATYYDVRDPDALAAAVRRALAAPRIAPGAFTDRTWRHNAEELVEVLRGVARRGPRDASCTMSEPLGRT